MLIGIMTNTSEQLGGFSPFDCEPQVLQEGDRLPRTDQRSTLENVVQTLRVFKQEWQRHQEFLVPFDVSRSTGLCPDVLAEVAQYLSLVDAINAFSIGILSYLYRAHSRVHLVDPSDQFLKKIPQHLNPKQITSVRLTDNFAPLTRDFTSFRIFDQLISLTIVSQQRLHAISDFLLHLPNVRNLSLWFDGELICNLIPYLASLSDHSITRLQIHLTGVSRNDVPFKTQLRRHVENKKITSFLFDSGQYQWRPRNLCRHSDSSCFLRSTVKFSRSLVNLRRVRFITDQCQIETSLHINLWQLLVHACVYLERVTIDVLDQGDFTERARNIEQQLRVERPGVIFRINTV